MNKTRITIRLDDEVLHHFREYGSKGYQSRINDALKYYISKVSLARGACTNVNQWNAKREQFKDNRHIFNNE